MTNSTAAPLSAEQLTNKYRKKPVVIEAVQWTGDNLAKIIEFTDGRAPDSRDNHAGMMWESYCDLVARDGLKIFTLEGKMNADVGDWIIRGVKGELYPCKPDIFVATYEPVIAQARSAAPAEQNDEQAKVSRPFAAPAGQHDASDLVAQPRLYARLMEMSEIIRAGSRWNGNEQEFADKSESDVAMLDDLLGDALRLAAEPPCEQSSTAGAAKGGNTSDNEVFDPAAKAPAAQADYTVDDSELARKIIVFLGRATTASMEPGADPLRDRLAERLALWRPAASPASTPEASQQDALFPERDQSKPAEQQGLFRKFDVRRVDGSDQPGGKHYGCRYYVLDLNHDQHAPAAMRAYAAACRATHPQLADDIEAEFGRSQQNDATSREAALEQAAREVEKRFIGYRDDDADLREIATSIRALKSAMRATQQEGE